MRIFVGDIQGCAIELEALLRRAHDRFGSQFELWCVGDLVNRGPDSLGVLKRLRDLHSAGRARLVLGNHDIALIACGLGLRKPHKRDTIHDVLGASDAGEWIDWLRSLPLIEAGSIANERFVMTHASVDPRWPAEKLAKRAQAVSARLAANADEARILLGATRLRERSGILAGADPDADLLDRLTCCRSVNEQGEWFSAPPDPHAVGAPRIPWHAAWSESGHDYHVVYGHWSLQGLHVAKGLRGLDTGCVYHRPSAPGYLTAWLPDLPRAFGDAGAFDAPDTRFWQEPARDLYFQSE